MYPLILSLGGFTLRIEACDRAEQKNILRSYRTFLTDRVEGLAVKINIQDFIPADIKRKKKFSLGDNWRMFKSDGKYCIELEDNDEKHPGISNRAIFNADFFKGTIFIQRDTLRRKAPSFGYPIDQLFFAHLLALHRGILVHGCGLRYKDEGLLFVGSSGAGKSTIGNLFKLHRSITILNDDRVIVRKENNRFFLYGTPWHGTLASHSSERVALKKIFFLHKAHSNKIVGLNAINASARLASLSFIPFYEKKFTQNAVNTIMDIARNIPVFELSFTPDKNVIDIIDDEFD